jgi:hypothetical protein
VNSRWTDLNAADQRLERAWRADFTGSIEGEGLLAPDRMKLPILLRLTRRGNSVTAAYSQDEGKTFHATPDPAEFNPPLAGRVYAGVAISPTNPYNNSEVWFSGLQIRKR